jgi:hypothetical protein
MTTIVPPYLRSPLTDELHIGYVESSREAPHDKGADRIRYKSIPLTVPLPDQVSILASQMKNQSPQKHGRRSDKKARRQENPPSSFLCVFQ